MDTFGRLPNELIDQITCLVQLPDIDIIDDRTDFYFCVKYHFITVKLKMIGRLRRYAGQWIYNTNDGDICQFITDVSDGIDCMYNEDQFAYKQCERQENFNIEFKNNQFIIYNDVSEVILCLECKDQLIEAMEKYQLLLNSYF